ncbi:prolipoprotein diacylglyceryl transferase [Ruminococcaceae bacterium OttesenSCG-928-I18]|nr:prolipoprotein diacylglyceryl transferase [Ruminococcaceae bacterium OttesenSCG-928-I18]
MSVSRRLELLFGGQVFYGGLLLGLAGMLLYMRACKIPYGAGFACVVPCVPLFHAFGRVGCWLGGCCYGVECLVPFVYNINPTGGFADSGSAFTATIPGLSAGSYTLTVQYKRQIWSGTVWKDTGDGVVATRTTPVTVTPKGAPAASPGGTPTGPQTGDAAPLAMFAALGLTGAVLLLLLLRRRVKR